MKRTRGTDSDVHIGISIINGEGKRLRLGVYADGGSHSVHVSTACSPCLNHSGTEWVQVISSSDEVAEDASLLWVLIFALGE